MLRAACLALLLAPALPALAEEPGADATPETAESPGDEELDEDAPPAGGLTIAHEAGDRLRLGDEVEGDLHQIAGQAGAEDLGDALANSFAVVAGRQGLEQRPAFVAQAEA